MAIKRNFALTLLGVLAVATVAPAGAQTTANPPKPSRQERQRMTPAELQQRRDQRRAERTQNNMNTGTMAGGMAPVSASNNTAVVQGNIDRANKTLSDMVALLDQIDARKKPGA